MGKQFSHIVRPTASVRFGITLCGVTYNKIGDKTRNGVCAQKCPECLRIANTYITFE